MLEGLEVSVLNFSKTFIDNSVKRFDAEYFKKEYLIEDNLRAKIKNKYLGDISFITDGQHGYHEVDENSPIRHLKAQNFKNWFAVDNNAERIAKWVDDNNKRSSLEVDDIVLTTRGSVGFCAIVKDDVLPANIDQDVARIKLNSFNEIIPQFLLSYINSRFGQDWTKRNQTGMVQQGLSLWRVREFPIPVLSKGFQEKVKDIIESSKEQINTSQNKYSHAETILLQEIGLQNYEPSKAPVNIKGFKESFGVTGRLDAEYYQKKYEDLIRYIKKNCEFKRLEDLTTFINNGNQPPYSETGEIIFFSQKWINDKGIDYSFIKRPNEPKVDKSFFDDNKNKSYLIKKYDILYYSVGANLGFCHNYLADERIAIGSFINLIRPDLNKINPIYIGIVLNSIVGRMQSEKEKSGVAQPYIYAKNLREFLIPIIAPHKQEQIAELVEESFKLKVESERLLEVAKKAVEMAIEVNEEKAMKYIKDNEQAHAS